MKFLLAAIMAIAVSFSSLSFASNQAYTQNQCVGMGELAYFIARSRDSEIPVEEIIERVTSAKGEVTAEQLEAFSEFVTGIYGDVGSPDSIGVAVIQACLDEISG